MNAALNARPGKRALFWLAYGTLLLGLTIAGAELVASFMVPEWPARMLRPVAVAGTVQNSDGMRLSYNAWGMRDRERSVERPAGLRFRSVLVGDSFLEGLFVPDPLAASIERQWSDSGWTGVEAIGLGVSATGPQQYYHRIERVALELRPDAIVLFVYAGNDFIHTSIGGVPPAIAELPVPSLLGTVAPRLTWLAVNKLRLSELGRGNPPLEGEAAALQKIVEAPAAERTARLVAHVHQFHLPDVAEPVLREVFSRGDGSFWRPFDTDAAERERLFGWFVRILAEIETNGQAVPRDADAATAMRDDRMIEATLGWIAASERLARSNGVKFLIALVPVGTGDPQYAGHWKSWPRYYAYSLLADARHRRLAQRLRETGLPFFDLRDALADRPGTYRLVDGHWTRSGHDIVAARMAAEIAKLKGF
jgi:lysophospholipase L1-like esterase